MTAMSPERAELIERLTGNPDHVSAVDMLRLYATDSETFQFNFNDAAEVCDLLDEAIAALTADSVSAGAELIERYRWEKPVGGMTCLPLLRDDGDWVRYEDHLRALAASDGKDRIAELEAPAGGAEVVAWRVKRDAIAGWRIAYTADEARYYKAIQPLVRQSDYLFERARAERAEAEIASLRAAPSAEAIREAVIEECANIADMPMTFTFADSATDGIRGSVNLASQVTSDAIAAAIRALRRARTTQENPNG